MSRWYRSHVGLVTDAKLAEAALLAESSRAVVIASWHAVLESCASVNDGGRFDTTARRVAAILGEPVNVIEAVFAAFADLSMVASGRVCAWSNRQFESDSSTERVRKHREAQRSSTSRDREVETAGEVSAGPMKRCGTPPDPETDSDPPLRPSTPVAPEAQARRREDDFEKFWRAMPAPDPAAKAAARVAFARLDNADQAQATAAAARYASAFAAKPTTRPISPARFLRERSFDGYSEPVMSPATQVFVRQDSPQWRAWAAYRGRPIPLNAMGGWHFPSEWPPRGKRERSEPTG